MSTSQRRSARVSGRVALDQAEAVIVDQYTRLVRLAYLTLPHTLTRHRRVLVAHALVQRALPGFRIARASRRVPGQRRGAPDPALARTRASVLRAALAHDRRPRGWPGFLPPPRTLRPMLPVVWGLRLFPRAGGGEEIALGQVLSEAPAAARAAFVLLQVEGLSRPEVSELLTAAGVPGPELALDTAAGLETSAGVATQALLTSREFDACSVQTRPTDLLRRRRRFQLAWLSAGIVALCCAVLLTAVGSSPSDQPALTVDVSPAISADRLVRTPRDVWADTSRVDFTAWPARGTRVSDTALITRALATWTDPPRGTRVRVAEATSDEQPPGNTQLLYAGDVGGEAVVLFHDGRRVVRYGEPPSPLDPASLDISRADEADVTTAASLVVSRGEGKVRYLTAPWIAEAQTRDLLDPDSPGRPLDVSDEGVTDAVPELPGKGACDSLPVLQLRSSSKIVEKHAFLVADLGGLTPVHLSYTPLPGTGAPPRQPREATSTAALESWARTGCRLPGMRQSGVRAVNQWDFAEQDLPERGGGAVWSCTRASTWRGPGSVLVQFRTSKESATAPAKIVGRARSTAACSRFGQHIVASTPWTAGSGRHYLLAAGSREVTGIDVTGDIEADKKGGTLAVKAPESPEVTVRARLKDGEILDEVGSRP
ncbi:hypothetical protein GCM10010277_76640 [Streptomyces longisporoflavus]|uniref:hypothetical protein n=1 Tax=Streptomyces longisporoflavus TaxID=28044 RepID=UPI00167D8EBB|nr:hypothetical protein [Streptomyces longisporoflavus]GGV67772.1 hypothetical protein GCM10010277_76640 [Streptomyces longisporoflavus]